MKKAFLKVLQNSQANNCARISSLIKLQAGDLQLYLKKTSAQSQYIGKNL